jgi:branched-chain amino acid transport system permease protein
MRAVSQNYDASRLMGIHLDGVISFTFVLGSSLAAIGGCLSGLNENQCAPLMGLIPGLKAFVAAVIGGIGNIPGAAAGGLILGILETYISTIQYHQTAILAPYKDAIAFLILILVLLIKPEGIFGKAVPEKV